MTNEDLRDFIRGKIADVESAIKSREDARKCFSSGTNDEWKIAASMHPSTAGRSLSKKDRVAIADREARIIIKLQKELEKFQLILQILTDCDKDYQVNPSL